MEASVGRKSHYFRHTFSAHNDPKIIELAELGGAKAIGVYWTLLEMYGAALRDDDSGNAEQPINLRLLANAVNMRKNLLGKCLLAIEKSGLIVTSRAAKRTSTCLCAVPNFMKYYGSYTKNGAPIGTKKRKEKKNKEKENKVNSDIEITNSNKKFLAQWDKGDTE